MLQLKLPFINLGQKYHSWECPVEPHYIDPKIDLFCLLFPPTKLWPRQLKSAGTFCNKSPQTGIFVGCFLKSRYLKSWLRFTYSKKFQPFFICRDPFLNEIMVSLSKLNIHNLNGCQETLSEVKFEITWTRHTVGNILEWWKNILS